MKIIKKLPEVKIMTGLSGSTIYAYIRQGKFPKPIPLGPRAVGWFEEEIVAWLEARAELRSEVSNG